MQNTISNNILFMLCHQNSAIDPIGCIVSVVTHLMQMTGIHQDTIQQAFLQEHHFNELLVQDQLHC